MVTVLRQPVAKMLRHLTRKTLFLPKHRIKSHISKIKQLPSPSPIFNVVLRKFQHDLLLWPTLRRERGGLKREDLIGTLDVQIRYNVSSLFASGCSMQNFRLRYPNTTKIYASNILFLRPICWEKRDALLHSKHHLLALEIPKDVIVDSLLT